MPPRHYAFAVTGLLLVACAQSLDQKPSAPAGATEAAPSAAPAPPPAEAPAPAAAPAAEPERMTPSPVRANELEEEKRDEGLAKPSDKDDLGQAVAELERARAELDRAIPSKQKPRPSSAPASAGASRGADVDQAPPAKAEKKTEESSCSTACRAFSSLGRAATAVCRLAGEKDARCTHAHRVVADARQRVAVCSCQTE